MTKSFSQFRWKTVLACLMAAVLVCSLVPSLAFAEGTDGTEGITTTANDGIVAEPSVDELLTLYESLSSYQANTMEPVELGYGYEWVVFGLARWDTIDEESKGYYLRNLASYLKEINGQFGPYSNTEYARIALALTSLGIDATDFEGYNLLAPLAEYENTISQGINGAIYALLAFDSGGYEIPQIADSSDQTQATSQMYVDHILSLEVAGGGWSFTEGATTADSDMTAMAIQALNAHRGGGHPGVDEAVERALEVLSGMQTADGGFGYEGTTSAESCVQVIIALNMLFVEITDERFVKDNNTVYDAFMTCYDAESGGVSHDPGGSADGMATYQGIFMLNSLYRDVTGERPLFDMTNLELVVYDPSAAASLPDPVASSGGGLPIWAIIGIAVAVVAVAGIVGYVVIKRRRNNA